MQRFSAILVATVAVVALLLNGAAAAEVVASATASVANADSLAYKQEAEAFATLAALPAQKTPADWSSEDTFMSAFVELEGDGMRKKSRRMAHRFVRELRSALKTVYPAAGALAAAAKTKSAEFDKNFRAHCKRVSPSRKMCKNFVTVLRLQFLGQNPFAEKNGNRKRFHHAVREIILRYVVAWRRRHPKRSKRSGGNPWSPVALAAAAKASGTTERADPMYDVELSTGVRGGLNRYGRLNAPPHKSEPVLNIKRDGDYALGSAMDSPYDPAKPYKARKHVKHLREKVLEDLQFLRDKVYTKINDKKFHRMIGDPSRAPKAIRRTARLCKRLRSEHFFPPTFCRSVEYLASVNFVGRNFLRNLKDFSALVASFMDHNHKYTTRYGYRVHRKPNYRQDVTVVRTKLAVKLRANRFNLRTFSREFVNMVSNVLAVPQSRIRIASVRLGGFHKLPGRRHTVVTFEFLPKKGDRRIRSRPHRLDSVDSLAEQFRAMALNRPGSDFYKVPILARVLPKSLILSKTLGRRPKSWGKRKNLQSKNVPRFAAVDQTIASDVAVTNEEVEAEADAVADAETTEFEQSDAEYSESDEELDAADAELSTADTEEVAAAEHVAEHIANIESHVEDTYAAAFEAQLVHDTAAYLSGAQVAGTETDAAQESEVAAEAEAGADAAGEVAEQSEAEAEAETEAAEATGEVALLEVGASDAVTVQSAALHLSADTMTDEEEEAEDAAEDAEDEAELEAQDEEEAEEDAQDEVEGADAVDDAADDEAEDEAEDETEEEADEAVDELDEIASADTLSADEEVENDAEWDAALLQNSEQIVASSDADDSAEDTDEDSADDEADTDAADEADADDELDAETDAAAQGASFADSNALTAPAESLAPLPEVNAVVEDAAAEQKVTAAANRDKASAANSVIAQALAAVDAEEAAAETVFVETATKVTAQTQTTLQQSAASPRATATAFVPLLAAALMAAVKLW